MARTNYNELLDAGVHFGHLKRKWNPNMAPYIFMERNGIHIIDLNKTIAKIDEAANALKQIAKSGKKILFVATKKQAKDVVSQIVKQVNMPYVTERWPGGMLTNFATIRKAVKKMSAIDKMATDGTFENISKKERLQITRERAKLEKQFGSIADLSRLPAAVFIIDIMKEHIAVAEAHKLNIPTFAVVDTNSNPNEVDFAIPANDDASKSISIILKTMVDAIQEGLTERKLEKDKAAEEEEREMEEEQEKIVEGSSIAQAEDLEEDQSDAAKLRRKAKPKENDDTEGHGAKKQQAKSPRGGVAGKRPRK
jgi:small subunit ribosomal protein S2